MYIKLLFDGKGNYECLFVYTIFMNSGLSIYTVYMNSGLSIYTVYMDSSLSIYIVYKDSDFIHIYCIYG